MITVTLNDANIHYAKVYDHYDEAGDWAKENCPSFVDYEPIDVSDFSTVYDILCEYRFSDEKDVVAFRLRWE